MEKVSKYKKLINKIYYYIFIEFKTNDKINFNFTDEKRWDLINEIIKKKNFKSYLEIGCDDDLLFSKINLDNKIGVDPRSGGSIRKTSDEFFKTNDKFFDIIFIDGLHEFDQVNKDIENSLKFLNNGGFVLLHDCLPTNMGMQAVPRFRRLWTGDVWKSIVKHRHNKDLLIHTLTIDMGISIIQKLHNVNPLCLDIKNFKKLKFKEFLNHHSEYMNEITYNDFLKLI
jgi:hypothetical protein